MGTIVKGFVVLNILLLETICQQSQEWNVTVFFMCVREYSFLWDQFHSCISFAYLATSSCSSNISLESAA